MNPSIFSSSGRKRAAMSRYSCALPLCGSTSKITAIMLYPLARSTSVSDVLITPLASTIYQVTSKGKKGRLPTTAGAHSSAQQRHREPDEHQLCPKYLQPPGTEKRLNTDGRNPHRPPGQKVASRIEWCEKGNPLPTIRHSI